MGGVGKERFVGLMGGDCMIVYNTDYTTGRLLQMGEVKC